MREQGIFGAPLANTPELAYTRVRADFGTLDALLTLREKALHNLIDPANGLDPHDLAIVIPVSPTQGARPAAARA